VVITWVTRSVKGSIPVVGAVAPIVTAGASTSNVVATQMTITGASGSSTEAWRRLRLAGDVMTVAGGGDRCRTLACLPVERAPTAGLVVVGGSGGGMPADAGYSILASLGYAVVTVAYFGMPRFAVGAERDPAGGRRGGRGRVALARRARPSRHSWYVARQRACIARRRAVARAVRRGCRHRAIGRGQRRLRTRRSRGHIGVDAQWRSGAVPPKAEHRR